MVHVPYRESYMPNLLSGQVQVAFPAIAQAIGYIRDGKLRALAVTETRRLEVLPDPANLRSNMFEMEWPPRSGRLETFPEFDRAAWFDI